MLLKNSKKEYVLHAAQKTGDDKMTATRQVLFTFWENGQTT